jgi:hypothetical protein
MSLAIAKSRIDQLIDIYEEATDATPLLIHDGNVMDFIAAEEMREGAIYGIALILGIASPNPQQSVSDEQWNTCIDYINTRNQSQAA